MYKIASLSRRFSCVLTVSICYPKSAQKRRDLVLNLQTTVDALRSRYSSLTITITSYLNLTKKAWLASSLSLNQIVDIPTDSSGSTLDLIQELSFCFFPYNLPFLHFRLSRRKFRSLFALLSSSKRFEESSLAYTKIGPNTNIKVQQITL